MVKLPAAPTPARLRKAGLDPADVVALAPHTVLWRISRTAGRYVLPWNALRHYGPLPLARFDPHHEPPRTQSRAVGYFGLGVRTCVAEAFQDRRVVDRQRDRPYLSGLTPTRALRLLDLSGTWPTRLGASQAVNSSPRRDLTRGWARSIREAFDDLDGLWYPSSMDAGQPCVALFDPAEPALPAQPQISVPLAHPAIADALALACREIGYHLI